MDQLTDVPEDRVPDVVKETLRAGAGTITITRQGDGNYTVSWE